jgi:LIM domain
MYRMNFYESTCLRCQQTVYQVDRIGPLKDFSFFHSGCFKCAACGTKLTLKTYLNNQNSQDDKEVYCSSHVPKSGPGHLDGQAVGIRSALNVPRSSPVVNEQIRGSGRAGTFDAEALNIRPHLNGHSSASYQQQQQQHTAVEATTVAASAAHEYGRFDASALHIAHALRATEIQKAYNKAREKPIDYYLVSRRRLFGACGAGRL